MNKIIIVNWSLVLLIKLHVWTELYWIWNITWSTVSAVFGTVLPRPFFIWRCACCFAVFLTITQVVYTWLAYTYIILKKISRIYSISLSVIKKSFRPGILKHYHIISKLCNRFKQSRSLFFYLYHSCTLIPWYKQVIICILDKCQD